MYKNQHVNSIVYDEAHFVFSSNFQPLIITQIQEYISVQDVCIPILIAEYGLCYKLYEEKTNDCYEEYNYKGIKFKFTSQGKIQLVFDQEGYIILFKLWSTDGRLLRHYIFHGKCIWQQEFEMLHYNFLLKNVHVKEAKAWSRTHQQLLTDVGYIDGHKVEIQYYYEPIPKKIVQYIQGQNDIVTEIYLLQENIEQPNKCQCNIL